MVPLPYSKLREHASLSRGPLPPKKSNGIRTSLWPSMCMEKEPCGLENPGNYCYRRSVLQSLFHLPAFLRVLRKHEQSGSMCSSQNCVACGLRKLSQTYWISNTHDVALKSGLRSFDKLVNDRAIASKDSKFMWDSRVKRWRVGDQHDAQEYLQYILDEIHDPRLPKTLKAKPDARQFKAQLENLFQLTYRQKMKCHNCDVQRPLHSSQTILGPLPLAISGNNTGRDISSHLKQFFKTEAIEIKCENKACSTFDRPKFKNRVEQKIISAPEVLMIQLKCYRNQGKMTSKANPNINYGLWLDLSDFASKELREEGNLRYKLSSVIFHQGHSLNSGHYVGTFVGPTGIHKISDSSVHKSTLNALLPNKNMSGTPYILTYTRTRGEAQGSQPQKSTQPTNEVNPMINNRPSSKPQHSTFENSPNSHGVRADPEPHPPRSSNSQLSSNENPFKILHGRPSSNPKIPRGKHFSSRDERPNFNPQHRRNSAPNHARRQKKKQKRRNLAR